MKSNEPLHQIFLWNVKNYRDKEALVEVDTGRRLTFHEMNNLCNQYANYFQVDHKLHTFFFQFFQNIMAMLSLLSQ